jgi:hypothetical protein
MAKSELTKLKDKAQKIFNDYIRKRDILPDGSWRCISCGISIDKNAHASHFYPVKGYSHLRYFGENVFVSCAGCNTYKHGNIPGYTKELRRRYGNSYLEMLEALAFSPPKKKSEKEEIRELLLIIHQYETFKKTGIFPAGSCSIDYLINKHPALYPTDYTYGDLFYIR